MSEAVLFHQSDEARLLSLQKEIKKMFEEAKSEGAYKGGILVPFFPLFAEFSFVFSSISEGKHFFNAAELGRPFFEEDGIFVPIKLVSNEGVASSGVGACSPKVFTSRVRIFSLVKSAAFASKIGVEGEKNDEPPLSTFSVLPDFSLKLKRLKLSSFKSEGFSYEFSDSLWISFPK